MEDSFKEDESHITFTVSGGLNGRGNWDDYLGVLRAIVTELMQYFSSVWVVKLENDCLDDVFCCTYGVKK